MTLLGLVAIVGFVYLIGGFVWFIDYEAAKGKDFKAKRKYMMIQSWRQFAWKGPIAAAVFMMIISIVVGIIFGLALMLDEIRLW